jgi:putative oxidoreductase
MDLGLLLLRLALAAILYMHATQKLLGWFSGPGLDRQAQVFHNLGHRPGRQMVMLASACELTGSALVALGLITPLGAAMLAGTMTVAGGTLTLAKGTFWNVQGGGEYALVLAAFAVVLGFAGPGRWSIDNAIGAPWVTHSNGRAAITGLIVLAVAALTAGAALMRTRSLLRPAAAPDPAPPATEASEG